MEHHLPRCEEHHEDVHHELPGEDTVLEILIDGAEDQVVFKGLPLFLWLGLNFLLNLTLFKIGLRLGQLFWSVFLRRVLACSGLNFGLLLVGAVADGPRLRTLPEPDLEALAASRWSLMLLPNLHLVL